MIALASDHGGLRLKEAVKVLLTDGRLVYQRNQVHFASVHPVALALFDPRKRAEQAREVLPRLQEWRVGRLSGLRGKSGA